MNKNKSLQIGKTNTLKIVKQASFGLYLDGLDQGNILLPIKDQPKSFEIGDELSVFIYLDSDDTLIATTKTPKALVGTCEYLKVKEMNDIGAFLDWGLTKDLLVPYNQQIKPMEEGRSYLVYVYVDENSSRIAASSKIDFYINDEEPNSYIEKQAVDIQIWMQTDLGYKVIINNRHIGLIYKSEIYQSVQNGQKLKAYIKTIRDDNRIDLTLQVVSQQARDEISQQIMDYLQRNDGVCFLTDKSPPDAIYKTFAVSKKQFKKALGGLYKQKVIVIEKQKITLVKNG